MRPAVFLSSAVKYAFRSMRRHGLQTFINIAGLAVGMASFWLIAHFVLNELAFDRFHRDGERIARVISQYTDGNGTRTFARANPAVAPTLKADFADVEETARLQRFKGVLRHEATAFTEDRMFFAEPSLLDIFTFPLLRGRPESALVGPNKAVVTSETAERYFGDQDPIGKVLVLGDTLAFTVTGIAAPVPAQSHLQFDVLLSFATWQQRMARRGVDLDQEWRSGTYYTYAKLARAAAIEPVNAQIPAYVERYVGTQSTTGTRYSVLLQPLHDIHLATGVRQELGPKGDATGLVVLAAAGIFVLLISCINFINLATAHASRRAREVGVRKAVGASRGLLVGQFLFESALLSLGALALGAVIFFLGLEGFSELMGRKLSFQLDQHAWYLPTSVALALFVGALAGVYPAVVLAAYKAGTALKDAPARTGSAATGLVRKGLVVFQFSLSIAIIASTILLMQQVDYMRTRNLGFEQERMLVVPFNWDRVVQDKYPTLKSELQLIEGVESVTASGDVPGRMFTGMGYWIEGMPADDRRGINALIIDPDFAETYGLEIIAGQDFSTEIDADLGSTFLLNAAAVAEMGMQPDEVIGKRFRMNTEGPVIGVVRDFHFEGLQKELEPLVMTVWPSWFGYISLRLGPGNVPQTIEAISDIWTQLIPNRPLSYFFLDEDFNRQYQQERRLSHSFSVFAALAIFISCLGLYGLTLATAESRRKEIGLRKVLGASAPRIILLLGRDSSTLVLVAALIASPAAWFWMRAWLQSFAYRIEIDWLVFAATAVLALLLMWLTIIYQTAKAALANPVDALKDG